MTDSHHKLDILVDTHESLNASHHRTGFEYDEDTESLVVDSTLSTSDISISNNSNFSIRNESAFKYECYEVKNDVDHLRPTTDKPVRMYCYIFPPKMYWYTLGQTVVALAHRYHHTINNVDRELTELP